MKRTCAVCGKEIEITVNKDKTYTGGHYFGELLKDAEYWECNKCYMEES
jgi:DNA-directed RNA polymerase subunit RPC12/RpoP